MQNTKSTNVKNKQEIDFSGNSVSNIFHFDFLTLN